MKLYLKKGEIPGHLLKFFRPVGWKPKDEIDIPNMVCEALREDGWYRRQTIIWEKRNPLPESCRDRCTKSHEYIFLLSKKPRYYYDADAIKEPLKRPEELLRKTPAVFGGRHKHGGYGTRIASGNEYKRKDFDSSHGGGGSGVKGHSGAFKADGTPLYGAMRNKRSVWTIATQPLKEKHFAAYPAKLITPCVLAGAAPGGTVLDPFAGSGTTGMVALQNGRNAILIELNPDYIPLIHKRCGING